MLGRLARWLRALGFDTAYDPEIDDAMLVRRAWEEGRWILTCDRRLPIEWRVRGCVVLEAELPELSAPLLRRACSALRGLGAWGTKFSGAGGDGSVIALFPSASAVTDAAVTLERELGVVATALHLPGPRAE